MVPCMDRKSIAQFKASLVDPSINSDPDPKNIPFVSNTGKTANFMLYWPSIATFTLVKGWNENKTKQLQDAVKKVVEKNSVLTGTASTRGMMNEKKIIITPGKYKPDTHEFVNVIRKQHDIQVPDFKNERRHDILAFMDSFISPIVPKAESVVESISKRSPLFGVDLIFLENGYACYVVKMSHCVGDGVTYFKIIQQINFFFNQKSNTNHLNDIDWSNEDISSHEIFPVKFSNKDVEIMYGIPFLLGLLRNTWNIKKQRKEYLILSKKKINEKKADFYPEYVSSNDIITAALCEANLSTEIFAFTMNKRALHSNLGGNYHQEIPFPKSATLTYPHNRADPRFFRSIVKKGWYYDTDDLPVCPFILGTIGRISSLATVQKLIVRNDMNVVCHAMLSSFVSNVPMDTAFISSMDSEAFVVLHNFREMKRGGLLDEIILEK